MKGRSVRCVVVCGGVRGEGCEVRFVKGSV